MFSYTKTRDNIIIQKFPLPRVLLHGQTDTTEDEDICFFKEVIDKSIRDAISSHNEAFMDIFHNAMREAIHGFLVSQADQLITTSQIHRPKGLIKSVPAIKKQHQLVMVMSSHFRVHLNKLKELLRIRYSTILNH